MLTWLLIGVGDITSKRVLPEILAEPRSRLAAIVTRDSANAAPYRVPAFTTLEAALRESDAAAVYVASPVFLHAPQSIAALRGRRHVLCEKPMAMDVADSGTTDSALPVLISPDPAALMVAPASTFSVPCPPPTGPRTGGEHKKAC